MKQILNKLFIVVTAACEVSLLTLCGLLAVYASSVTRIGASMNKGSSLQPSKQD
jgi:hypothetical protein